MRLNIQYIAAAAVIMAVACTSCKGRYADSTPNGQTIEVDVTEPAESAIVNAGDSTGIVMPTDAPVVTKVSSNKD